MLYIKIFVLIGAVAAMIIGPLSVSAEQAFSGQQPNPQDVFIFGYPGTTCPGGSERYKGPDQVLAADTGAVYCRFVRKVSNVSKVQSGGKCPWGTKPYADARAKPDDDVIWCQPDVTADKRPPVAGFPSSSTPK